MNTPTPCLSFVDDLRAAVFGLPSPAPGSATATTTPADAWPAWTDADRFALGPAPDDADRVWWAQHAPGNDAANPCPDEPDNPLGFTLAELVDQEARAYRAWNTPVGDLLAETIEALAHGIRATEARDVATYRDRIEVLNAEATRDQSYQAGYVAGLDAGYAIALDRDRGGFIP